MDNDMERSNGLKRRAAKKTAKNLPLKKSKKRVASERSFEKESKVRRKVSKERKDELKD